MFVFVQCIPDLAGQSVKFRYQGAEGSSKAVVYSYVSSNSNERNNTIENVLIFLKQRYRTPSRSRSRSRSVTPPHWKQAQKRVIKLTDLEVINSFLRMIYEKN